MAWGIEASNNRNPIDWPSLAPEDDVKGLPPAVITVNECDPLRDGNVVFYRLLLASGVSALCRQMIGAPHGIGIFPVLCPDIARSTAVGIANFAKTV